MDIKIDFVLPAPTDRERPLDGVSIEARRDPSLPWTEQGFVEAPGTSYTMADVEPGPYYIRGTVIDDQGESSAPLELSEPVQVPYNPPQGLQSINAELV